MKLIIEIPNYNLNDIQNGSIACGQILKAVKNGISYEEIPQGEWIPVSERLPKKGNQSYLVTVDYGEGIICSCQRFFFNDEIGWNDDCVIAWQSLPEPYQKGGAE